MELAEKKPDLTGKYGGLLQMGLILIALYLSSFYSYVLFHSLSELASIVVAFGSFALIWNSRRYLENGYFLFIGIALLFVGLIDSLHTFAYKGMAVFTGEPGANLATELWLAARYLAAAAFLFAPSFTDRRISGRKTFFYFFFVTAALLASIFWWRIFPDAYIEGQGLTTFKKMSEAVISFMFAGAFWRLYARRKKFDSRLIDLISWSIIFTVVSEILFTLYASVYDFVNLAGHLLKVAAFYLIYLAIIEIGLKKPFRYLFKELKDNETALRFSEQKFRAIFENASVGIVMADMTGRPVAVNEKFEKMTGYPKEELYHKEFPEFTHPDDVSLDWQELKEMKQGRRSSYELEKRYLKKDGGILWADTNVSLIRDEYGEPLYTLGVIRDIGRQRAAEEEIKKLAKFPEENPNPVLRIDQNGIITYANPESRALLRAWGSSVGLEAPERWKKLVERALRDNSGAETAEIFEGKTISLLVAPLKDYGYANVYGRDITAKQKVEEELRQSEKNLREQNQRLERLTVDLEKFQRAVSNAQDLIIITDADGRIVFANQAAEAMTGYSRAEMINQRASLWGGGMAAEFYKEMWRTIKEQKLPFKGEIINRKKSGERFIADTHVSPIVDEQERVVFFVGVERDVTRAKEIDQAKTEFVSLASHQLRTPLSSISLAVELLLRGVGGETDERQKRYLEEIYGSAKRMTDLINALLNISRIELGTFAVKPEPTNLAKEIDCVLDELALQISGKRLKLTKSYEAGLPVVRFDRNILRIIAENLITNAIRYTPKNGRIAVALGRGDNGILFTVSDTGHGIPKRAQSKIFDKLFRAENAKEINSEGAGLGLYIVRSVAEKVGARVWFESEEDKGTTFFVLFPLKEETILS